VLRVRRGEQGRTVLRLQPRVVARVGARLDSQLRVLLAEDGQHGLQELSASGRRVSSGVTAVLPAQVAGSGDGAARLVPRELPENSQ